MAAHCPTCRCGPIPVCLCGHLDVMHDLPKRKGGYVRTGCSVTTAAGTCPCTTYTPVEEDR